MVPPSSDRIARVPPYSRTSVLISRTGLSPALARLSRLFRYRNRGHWPDPRSLATTSGVSVDVLSSGYLDVSVPRVRFKPLWIQDLIPSLTPRSPNPCSRMRLEYVRSKGGFPIRKSLDHSSFAAPQGLSQRTTSFIASQRQGIHRMLLRHLIALMIDARRFAQQARTERPASGSFEPETLCLPNTSQSALSHKPRMCSLFTISNIRASPIGKARIQFIPDTPRWP